MPRLDGTGPRGQGPMTGRGMGRCKGGLGVTQRRRNFGRCFGRGIGRFFGTRKLTQEEKRSILEEEAENLKKELEGIKAELTDLDK